MSIFTMEMIFGIRRYLQIKEKQIVDASICREVSLICKERKQDKDTLIKQQASSSAIERKSKMQSSGCKHLQVPQKEKQDTIAY